MNNYNHLKDDTRKDLRMNKQNGFSSKNKYNVLKRSGGKN